MHCAITPRQTASPAGKPPLSRRNTKRFGRSLSAQTSPEVHPPRRAPAAAADNGPSPTGKGVPEEADAATKKYGLEAGLWKVISSRDSDSAAKGASARELLKRYGSAYLLTSISFALVSFAACYALVASGVDVRSVLSKVGLQVTDTSEKVGTAAIAYAAHKALSPVRFPPTVALTPVVARWLGKDVDAVEGSSSGGDGKAK